jgi:hypothetical protein
MVPLVERVGLSLPPLPSGLCSPPINPRSSTASQYIAGKSALLEATASRHAVWEASGKQPEAAGRRAWNRLYGLARAAYGFPAGVVLACLRCGGAHPLGDSREAARQGPGDPRALPVPARTAPALNRAIPGCVLRPGAAPMNRYPSGRD